MGASKGKEVHRQRCALVAALACVFLLSERQVVTIDRSLHQVVGVALSPF